MYKDAAAVRCSKKVLSQSTETTLIATDSLQIPAKGLF
jgi:hypothetical protein